MISDICLFSCASFKSTNKKMILEKKRYVKPKRSYCDVKFCLIDVCLLFETVQILKQKVLIGLI